MLLKYHKNSGFEHDDLLNLFILTVNKQFKTLRITSGYLDENPTGKRLKPLSLINFI